MTLIDTLAQAALPDDALRASRHREIERLRQVGLPDSRTEGWRHTSLRALGARAFALRADADPPAMLSADCQARLLAAPQRIVFLNGRLRTDLSTITGLADGLSVDPTLADSLLDTSAIPILAAANLALAEHGVQIEVAAGRQIAEPLKVFLIGAPATLDLACHVRIQLRLHPGAALTLIEEHLATAATRHFDNVFVEALVAERATLVHLRTTATNPSGSSYQFTRYQLLEQAQVTSFTATPGLGLERHDTSVLLDGKDAAFSGGGVLALAGRAHADVQVRVQHRAGDTRSQLIWRGLAADRARASFTGSLIVAAGADGADARLSAKNLLLSAHAEINCQPVLEINADEVKAAHGATVGSLDAQALFYLRSRGIDAETARSMLMRAFAMEALAVLEDATMRADLESALEQLLNIGTAAA
jgi:Fe-S cluster assembly protein SufD